MSKKVLEKPKAPLTSSVSLCQVTERHWGFSPLDDVTNCCAKSGSTFCNLCSQFKGKSQGVKCVIELKSGDEKCTVLIYYFMFLGRRMLAVKLSREKAWHLRLYQWTIFCVLTFITGAQWASSSLLPTCLVPCYRSREIALRASWLVQALRVQWIWSESRVWHFGHLAGCSCSGAWLLIRVTQHWVGQELWFLLRCFYFIFIEMLLQ